MQEKKSAKNLKIRKVSIVGVIPSFAFQRAKHCALELHRKLPQRFPLPEIVGLLELDWSEKLQEWRQMLGREYWCLRRPVAVFFDNRFIGSDIELIKLTTISNILMENIPRKDMSCLKQNFQKDYISYLKKSKRVYCYLDICVDDVYAGTLTFRLYSDLLPRTCENFKTLCLGSRGPLLSYKGSRIHRIVKKGWLQGGDIQYKTGGGGFSIFCDPLEDECFGISHDRRGVLSMANGGRHKNGSQFFITLQPSKWMDTHFVAFGQLIEGVKVLKTLEELETFYECPVPKVEIKNCGKLDLGDVEDIDVLYKEERMPAKKRKRIETISEQIMRQIMEALTKALMKKVHAPDILDDGDVPSKMNLQLYFQGFYSLPQSIYERSAAYLRNLRRELFRLMKPSATEIVESLVYDLQMAVLTRMTNLDDMRETIGRDLYNKMISGIDMTLEGCKKSYVKRFIDQIVTTAENMVDLVTKKLLMMKRQSKNLKNFQERMDNWVKSFVLQETYEGDNYFIAQRPVYPEKPKQMLLEGKECCAEERKKKEIELKAKLRAKYAPEDFCCLGSQLHLSESSVNVTDYFSTCRDNLKRKGKPVERMPLLDLIEISRFKLRWIRHQEKRKRSKELLCTEKKIRKWMEEVVYTAETAWLKDAVFPRNCRVLDHVEEIMYGAMTAALLEMYFYEEEYLRICGGKRKKLVTRTIYPEDWSSESSDGSSETSTTESSEDSSAARKKVTLSDVDDGRGWDSGRDSGRDWGLEYGENEHDEEEDTYGRGKHGKDRRGGKELPEGFERRPCPCGHPCCDCEFDPNQIPGQKLDGEGDKGKKKKGDKKGDGTKEGKRGKKKRKGTGKGFGGDYGEDGEGEESGEGEGEGEGGEGGPRKGTETGKTGKSKTSLEEPKNPCKSDETLVNLNAVLAQRLSTTPEEINIHSFKWLKPYILQKGCDLKTKFASRVHEWIEGDRFNTDGIFSQHSLVTRASLLSLSLSLAELIKEENNVKTEIKNFIYDLWDLYFEEMFKEALLQFPPKDKITFGKAEGTGKEKDGRKQKGAGYVDSDTAIGGRSDTTIGEKSQGGAARRSQSAVGRRSTVRGKPGGRSQSAVGRKTDGKSKVSSTDRSTTGGKSKTTSSPKSLSTGDKESSAEGVKGKGRKDGKGTAQDDSGSETETEDDGQGGRGKAGGKRKKKDKKKMEDECKKLKEMLQSSEFERYCRELKEKERKEGKTADEVCEDEEILDSEEEIKKEPKEPVKELKGSLKELKEPVELKESVEDEMKDDEKEKQPEDLKEKPVASQTATKSTSRGVTLDEKSTARKSEDVESSLKKSIHVQKSASRMFLMEEKSGSRKFDTGRGSKRSTKRLDGLRSGSDTSIQEPTFRAFKDAGGSPSSESLEGEAPSRGKVQRYQSTLDDMFDVDLEKKFRKGKPGDGGRVRKATSPFVIEEFVDEPSVDEVRQTSPYAYPFWVKFLTEMTKQALGTFARVSRLPRRIYLKTDSQMRFDEKMKDWFEFNAFNPQPTKGREVIDFIALHHKTLTNLDDTARSFLRKKKFSNLINRCTRFASADELSGEILADAIKRSHDSARVGTVGGDETVELFVSGVLSSAAASKARSDENYEMEGEDEHQYETDEKEHDISETEEQ